jgi:integrase/recombinase XerD
MKQINLETVIHRNEKRLLVKFPYDSELIGIIKKVEVATFSATHKSWHVPNNKETLNELFRLFKEIATIDTKKVNEENSKLQITNSKLEKEKNDLPAFEMLDDAKRSDVLKFKYWMKQRRYSDNTIKTYTDALKIFFRFFHNKPKHKINNKDLQHFNNEYIIANKYSVTYQSQVINAVKLFYKRIEEKELDIEKIDRPRKVYKLPNVLSQQEIAAILKASKNIKHKSMLSVIYSCALRRGELLNLKPADVDSKRNLLIIRNAKGYKDRVAPLSDKIIEMLRIYYKEYKPKTWLFEGWHVGEKYSEESLSHVLKKSLSLTKIKKPVSLHWLRHSCATHMLENGVDLRYIQEILGHKSSKTTEIYTHVTNKSLQKIKSPFDDLDLE